MIVIWDNTQGWLLSCEMEHLYNLRIAPSFMRFFERGDYCRVPNHYVNAIRPMLYETKAINLGCHPKGAYGAWFIDKLAREDPAALKRPARHYTMVSARGLVHLLRGLNPPDSYFSLRIKILYFLTKFLGINIKKLLKDFLDVNSAEYNALKNAIKLIEILRKKEAV